MKITGLLLLLFLFAGFAYAQDATSDKEKITQLEQKVKELEAKIDAMKTTGSQDSATQAQIDELKRQVQVLAEELEKLRNGEPEEAMVDEATRKALGLSPSASHVYSKKQGVSIAGYGELLYENFGKSKEVPEDELASAEEAEEGGTHDKIDLLRAVVYFGYRFNDRWLFNSEMEFEHASTGEGGEEKGEAEIEFSTIDFRAYDALTIRGGLMLMPMGLTNEFHEPNVFLGTERSLTETVIIPSTWAELGFGIAGRRGIVDYRAYVVNALNADGFSADQGIREGRQEGSNARIHPAFVGRVDVTPTPGLMLGGSAYTGNSGLFGGEEEEEAEALRASATAEEVDEDKITFGTHIFEVHAQYQGRGFDLRGLYAHYSIDDTAFLNEDRGFFGEDAIGKAGQGGYIQAGYNLLAKRSQQMSFIPYFRYEKVNTQSSVAAGFAKDPENDVTIFMIGAEFKPIPNIVIKADYQNKDNEEDTGVNQFNINLGYSF